MRGHSAVGWRQRPGDVAAAHAGAAATMTQAHITQPLSQRQCARADLSARLPALLPLRQAAAWPASASSTRLSTASMMPAGRVAGRTWQYKHCGSVEATTAGHGGALSCIIRRQPS